MYPEIDETRKNPEFNTLKQFRIKHAIEIENFFIGEIHEKKNKISKFTVKCHWFFFIYP